jgi:hypothetical protein
MCYKSEDSGSSPDEVIDFFNLPNPSSHLGFSQPVTDMSTKKNCSGSKARPSRDSDNLTAMYESIV